MNDRFRFRVWNIKNKEMIYNAEIAYDGTTYSTSWQIGDNQNDGWVDCFGYYLDYDNEYAVMQCTGLKDSNGRLIYEGDIVEVKYIGGQIPLFKNEYVNEPESERFQIYWNENWCSWSGKNDNYRGLCEIHSLDISKFLINTDNKIYEVIGNIYENEELLKV